MPHITLEYSDNLPDKPDFRALFAELHQTLVGLGDVQVNDIKSRAIKLTDWYVGDGNPRHAFVHLKLYFINRRTDEFKRRALAVMHLSSPPTTPNRSPSVIASSALSWWIFKAISTPRSFQTEHQQEVRYVRH